MKTWKIDFEGSYTSRCDELDLKVRLEKGGGVSRLARLMLDAGAVPDDEIIVYRDDAVVFPAANIMGWAKYNLVENDTTGFRVRKHEDFTRKVQERAEGNDA